jgi:hypothetical protein
MTHRVYLRWHPQRVTDKTTTEDEAIARLAFEKLSARADLIGQRVAVAWTCDNKQHAYHDFAAATPPA